MRSRTRFVAALALLGASSVALACSALLDLQPPPQGVNEDAASDDAPDDATIDPGCPIRYVSAAAGSDANDGCKVEHAFKTITKAIAAVNSAHAPGYDIHIAGGTYNEDNLVVSLPGALSGGWDEAFAGQVASTMTGATVLRVAAPGSANRSTLTLAPIVTAGTPVTTRISGLRVVGPNVEASFAVHVIPPQTLPAPGPIQVTACDLIGGDASGSRALSVISATPDVGGNTITSGTAASAAAVELNSNGVRSLSARLHGNAIVGQNAPSTSAVSIDSVAVIAANVTATAATGNAIEGNSIRTQSGVGIGGVNAGMFGIQITNAVADVIGNTITSSGGSVGTESPTGIIGVFAGTKSVVRIAANRIASGGTPGAFGDFAGIKASMADSVVIVNNMIYAGQTKPDSSPTVNGSATGIFVDMTASALIADNSIYTGFPVGTKAAFGIFTGVNQQGVVISGNIIAGSGTADWGVKAGVCPVGIATLTNNLFVGEALGPFNIGNCQPADGGIPAPKDLASITPFVGHSSGNLLIRGTSPSCSPTDGSSCIVVSGCTTGDSCVSAVFDGFGADHGATAFETGWHLVSGVPCAITTGGADVTLPDGGTIARDYYGATRSGVPVAIGAAQYPADAGPCN